MKKYSKKTIKSWIVATFRQIGVYSYSFKPTGLTQEEYDNFYYWFDLVANNTPYSTMSDIINKIHSNQ